jgi:hypothetical protein
MTAVSPGILSFLVNYMHFQLQFHEQTNVFQVITNKKLFTSSSTKLLFNGIL